MPSAGDTAGRVTDRKRPALGARETADTALEGAWRFLAATGILSEVADVAPWRAPPGEPQRVIAVTDPHHDPESDAFRFFETYEGFEVIPRLPAR